MAVLSTSFRLYEPITGNLQLLFDIRTGPTDRPSLREILLSSDATANNNSWNIGVGRNGSLGSARVNSSVFTSEDGDGLPAGGVTIGFKWDTTPTSPTNYFRRIQNKIQSAGTFGMNLLIPLHGLTIEPSSSFGIWLIAGSNADANPINWHGQVSVEI